MENLEYNGRRIGDFKVTELREALGNEELSKTGKKSELIDRLGEHLSKKILEEKEDKSPATLKEAMEPESTAKNSSSREPPPDDPAPTPRESPAKPKSDEKRTRKVVKAPSESASSGGSDDEGEEKSKRLSKKTDDDESSQDSQNSATKTALNNSVKPIIASVDQQNQNPELDFDEGLPEEAPEAKKEKEARHISMDTDDKPGRRIVKSSRRDDAVKAESKEALTEDGLVRERDVEAPRHPVTEYVHIRCLVRPFTVPQLKELLAKFGDLDEENFWIDAIKTNCIAKYKHVTDAEECRNRLHNCKWPPGHGRGLRIDFANEEIFNKHKNPPPAKSSMSDRPGIVRPPERVTEPLPAYPAERLQRRVLAAGASGGRRLLSDGTIVIAEGASEEPVRSHRRVVRGGDVAPIEDERLLKRRRIAEPEPIKQVKTLEELFNKTKAKPCLYWKALTDEEAEERAKAKIAEKEARREERRQRIKEEEEKRAEKKAAR